MNEELMGKILDAVADLEIGILALGDAPPAKPGYAPIVKPGDDYPPLADQKRRLATICEQAILAAIEEAGYIYVGKEAARNICEIKE